MNEKRREARYPARIIVRVLRKNHPLELLTNDVSFRGVFIRTDAPPTLRQLVKIELVLPDGAVIGAHAMVVHVRARPGERPTGEGDVLGIGLQFWGPLERPRDWERFIHELRTRERSGTPAAKATDKVRRNSERFKLTLEVTLDGKQLKTRDVSENGMAIRTDTKMPVGMRTELKLHVADRTMCFDIVVRREIDEPGFRGLGVELVDMTAEQRAEVVRLVHGHRPSEPPIYVTPGDPKLH